MKQYSDFDWIGKWSIYAPNKVAIKELESGETITFAALNQQAEAWCNYFQHQLKVKQGDRIVIIAENCIEYIVLFAVAQKLGVVLVPLNYRLSQAEIQYLVNDCKPVLLVVEEKFQDLVATTEGYRNYSLEGFKALSKDLKQKGDFDFTAPQVSENDPIFILYTSGTTGNPKGAIYTHKMMFWNSLNTELRLDINSNDVTITVMPPFHTGGWNVLLTPFLHHGATTILSKKFEANDILNALETEQVTLFMGVPTMLKMMADSPSFNQVKLEKLRYFIVGGEAMPVPLIETWAEKGVMVRQGYGLTEVGPNVTSLHHDDAIRKKGSIGTVNFYIKYRILNEAGELCEPNELGEFQLAGDGVLPGYWHNEEASKSALHDGWFKTGDIVRQDEEGYIYVMDRIKNMYISGGENVYPAEVEKVLVQHPKIKEVAVVGVHDAKWGETGLAAIVSDNSELTLADIKSFCENKLAKFKWPKHILLLKELPKNDSGKIDRKSIKNQFNTKP